MSRKNPNPVPAAVGQTADDHDSPWKDALEIFFSQAIALLAPDLHALIDWSVSVDFLDKELQAIQRASTPANGRQLVDKLVKVQLLAGASALLLVHIEVQGRLSTPTDFQVFGWRIFQYRMLIQVRELRKTKALLPPTIFSLGVLIDQPPNPGRAPRTQGSYQDKFLSQRTEFTFPIVELSQWHGRMDTLDALAPTNPFAVIVMAQILASMHADKATRLGPLLNIVRRLYDYGYSKDQINPLLRLVEWIIHLPQDLESEYFVAVDQLHQEHNMSYVTVVERVYTQRGLEQGREEGIEQGQALLLLGLIERRFGPVSDETVQRIQQANRQQLTAWSLNILDAKALDGVFLD